MFDSWRLATGSVTLIRPGAFVDRAAAFTKPHTSTKEGFHLLALTAGCVVLILVEYVAFPEGLSAGIG